MYVCSKMICKFMNNKACVVSEKTRISSKKIYVDLRFEIISEKYM